MLIKSKFSNQQKALICKRCNNLIPISMDHTISTNITLDKVRYNEVDDFTIIPKIVLNNIGCFCTNCKKITDHICIDASLGGICAILNHLGYEVKDAFAGYSKIAYLEDGKIDVLCYEPPYIKFNKEFPKHLLYTVPISWDLFETDYGSMLVYNELEEVLKVKSLSEEEINDFCEGAIQSLYKWVEKL